MNYTAKSVCIIGPALKLGGMERASVNLANSVSKMGYPVTYIALFSQEKFFQLNKEIKFIEPIGFNSEKLSFSKTLQWIRKETKQVKPDRIIVFNKFYSAIVLLALAGTKFKVFISERSSPLFDPGFKVRLMNRLIFWCLKPYGIIAQTSIAADHQSKYYGKDVVIRVIPNTLRFVKHYPDIKRERIVLAVGRLGDPLKGFDRLVEAFSKIKAEGWKLCFAGGDSNGHNLKRQADTFGIGDRVEFLGQIKDLDPLYAKASIFVIPSRSEGFPNALCEAMAAGLACISYDFIAGPRDIITDGNDGYIIEEGNIEALAAKIDWLINNEVERKRIGENALALYKKLREDVIGKKVINFILN